MPTYHDFGTGHVPITGDDVLFLDSNFIIAYLLEDHKFHLPCANFLMHIYGSQQASMAISEISVSEVMFAIARSYFLQDEMIDFKAKFGRSPSDYERGRLSRGWNKVIKDEPVRLQRYNRIAEGIFLPFLDYVYFLSASETQIKDAIHIMVTTPMASADALLASSAVHHSCSGIITIDGDFTNLTHDIHIYKTTTQNGTYDTENMMRILQTKDFWVDSLGEEAFIKKFGFIP